MTMADIPANFPSYDIKYSDTAMKSRKELPLEAKVALADVVDDLAENPNAFPNRTSPISADEHTYLVYRHPSPAFQITYEVDEQNSHLYLLHIVAPKVQVTKPVFISYSHKDREWLGKLKKFLQPLEEQGLIDIWDDTEIRPGEKWFEKIKLSLESAQIAVFLITQDFLTSAFIGQKELPMLLEKAENHGCLIYWVAVSFSTVEDSPLVPSQAANDPEQPLDTLPEPEQNRVLKSIYDKMKAAVR
jgi:mRNA-degrading endonuclease RelE of RelBE toxin-antitoxin system